MVGEAHPYIPRDLDLPDYVAVVLPQSTIIGVYLLISLLVFSFIWLLSEFFKDKTGFYLAEVWKEYSKGDSRYVARDSAVVSVEGITTVVEGPLCVLAVYAIAMKKSYSYILQVAISLGQLYGTLVYFLTSYLDGDNFATDLFYYYAYYVFCNAFWILIPTLIIIRCWKKICVACEVKDYKGKAKVR